MLLYYDHFFRGGTVTSRNQLIKISPAWQVASIQLQRVKSIVYLVAFYFLALYSPELNPQEYVNQDLKTNIIGQKRPINKAQMRSNVEDFMTKRKNDKSQVQKYFHAKHIQYAA